MRPVIFFLYTLPMNITIRRPQPEEWQLIQTLNNEVFQNDKDHDDDLDLNWPYTEIGITYYKNLANGSYGHCLVAEVEGKVTGYVALAKKDFDYRKSKYVEVENIGVSSEYRSQGIGQQLVAAAADWARTQGAQRLYVSAFWENKAGIKFYKQNGFREIGIELEKML